ncbi:uncharacterized protein FIBRA_00558 [Fibroporia radiculosa]|uniref:Uncharacterized protein n=1 Tax=Fibroporia radiculosa TaxID=599839 RepID=J4G0E7_9APHY|nr:uncharacterized protein FIBRA_00558 [Fibroporia radiculosa]CCL98558.1 predicted protein [Fibroporia radiculosa]
MPYTDIYDSSLPDSSPASSPSPYDPADSSPPSSPSLTPIRTPQVSPGPIHPYAASTKATKAFRIYDQRSRPLGWSASRGDMEDDEAHDQFYATDFGSPRSKKRPYTRPKSFRESSSGGLMGYSYARTSSQAADPLAGSAKGRPPRRKRDFARVRSDESTCSSSSILSCASTSGASTSTAQSEDVPTDCEESSDLFSTDNDTPRGSFSSSDQGCERAIWDKAITEAVDSAHGVIYLANGLMQQPLTQIPPSIADLAGLVVLSPDKPTPHQGRPFMRAATLPTLSAHNWSFLSTELLEGPSSHRQLVGKSASFVGMQPAVASSHGQIKLFLNGHAFRTLPAELFQLSGLTVLTLRNNAITELPPQIATLTNLRELNVAFNKLQWLPAEMLDMHLETLSVTGNPWLVPPMNLDEDKPDDKHTSPRENSRISPTIVHFLTPLLAEYCLRLLFSPAQSQSPVAMDGGKRAETVLEAYYALPLPCAQGYPIRVMDALRACLPAAVAKPSGDTPSPSKKPKNRDTDDVHTRRYPPLPRPQPVEQERTTEADRTLPGISVCASPVHQTSDGQWVDGHTPVFVHHAEERFTWERIVAGQDVGAAGGIMGVPARWRGCSRGCLDFLDEEDKPKDEADDEDTDVDMDGDVDVGSDGELGVQVVDLSSGGLMDLDDFDE